MPGAAVRHVDDPLSSGTVVAVLRAATVVWSRAPSSRSAHSSGLVENRSRFSDQVFYHVYNRYGVVLNEDVVDLIEHSNGDIEVVERAGDERYYSDSLDGHVGRKPWSRPARGSVSRHSPRL